MKAPSVAPSPELPTDRALLSRWAQALVFRIGEPGLSEREMLPDSLMFPRQYLAPQPVADVGLGLVLGTALLKLFRQSGLDFYTRNSRMDGLRILDFVPRRPRGRFSTVHATDELMLGSVGRLIHLSLNAPQCLPTLVARLDAISNQQLHEMALAAVRGTPSPYLFAWPCGEDDHV